MRVNLRNTLNPSTRESRQRLRRGQQRIERRQPAAVHRDRLRAAARRRRVQLLEQPPPFRGGPRADEPGGGGGGGGTTGGGGGPGGRLTNPRGWSRSSRRVTSGSREISVTAISLQVR